MNFADECRVYGKNNLWVTLEDEDVAALEEMGIIKFTGRRRLVRDGVVFIRYDRYERTTNAEYLAASF